jgi:hypothetical protein
VALIVEVVDRNHRVIERHRFDGDRVQVGRAYDNDLVIAEPHVDARHCLFERDADGGWHVRDLDSVNGVRVRNRRIHGQAPLASGTELVLGRARLHVLDAAHPVPPALPLNAIERLLHAIEQPLALVAIVAAVCATAAWQHYAGSAEQLEASQYLAPAFQATLPALGWALLWSIAGSLLKHEARFAAHFASAGLVLLARGAGGGALHWLAFNAQSLAFSRAGTVLLDALMLYLLLSAALYLATHQPPRGRHLRAGAAAGVMVAALAIVDYADRSEFSNAPEFLEYLLPDSFRFVPAVDVDTFLETAAQTFATSDARRDEMVDSRHDAAAPDAPPDGE